MSIYLPMSTKPSGSLHCERIPTNCESCGKNLIRFKVVDDKLVLDEKRCTKIICTHFDVWVCNKILDVCQECSTEYCFVHKDEAN